MEIDGGREDDCAREVEGDVGKARGEGGRANVATMRWEEGRGAGVQSTQWYR